MAADDWIKIRTAIHEDPAVFSIERATNLNADSIVGKLVKFWGWADAHCEETEGGDGFAPGIDAKRIDRLVGRRGFGNALAEAGWAVFDERGITLPRYTTNNGTTGKSRAQAAKRQAKRRGSVTQSSRGERDSSVTKSAAEERRGEKRRGDARPSVRPSPAPESKSPPTPPTEGAAQPRSEGMDGRVAALAEAGIGGKWADALLASKVTLEEIQAETKRAKASKTVRSVEAVVAAALARRYDIELPGKGPKRTKAENGFLDSVHRKRGQA